MSKQGSAMQRYLTQNGVAIRVFSESSQASICKRVDCRSRKITELKKKDYLDRRFVLPILVWSEKTTSQHFHRSSEASFAMDRPF